MSELGALAAGWWAWMAPLAVQALAFAALVLVLDQLLARRGWPQLRHALWLLAALRFLLPPTLASPASLVAWLEGLRAVGAAGPVVGLSSAGDSPAFDPLPLFALWIVGLLVAGALALRSRFAVRRALAGRPAPAWMQHLATRSARRLQLRRVPRLVLVSGLPSACVHGLLRPVIALPARAERADVEALLLHELAHVKRSDLWFDAALTALRAVFWFHPAAHLVARRVAQIRELCCDATAAAALGPRAGEYRATLLRAAARLVGEPAPQLAFAGASSQIVARLRSLERGPARHPALRSAATGLVTLALAACVLPMARPAADPANAASLAAARQLIASAMDGSSRPGCLRLHYAAMRIAAESEPTP